MRKEKFICSFVFDPSGFSPKTVVMVRWLPFWFKEDDCSNWKKGSPEMRGYLALPEQMEQGVCFFLTTGAKIIIFNCHLIQKGICGRRLWRNLNWKIIILVLFVHVLVSWNAFSQSISSSFRSQSLYHFVWEALGFSLFVATRFLYVLYVKFPRFLESFSDRFNLNGFQTVDIFLESLPYCL